MFWKEVLNRGCYCIKYCLSIFWITGKTCLSGVSFCQYLLNNYLYCVQSEVQLLLECHWMFGSWHFENNIVVLSSSVDPWRWDHIFLIWIKGETLMYIVYSFSVLVSFDFFKILVSFTDSEWLCMHVAFVYFVYCKGRLITSVAF